MLQLNSISAYRNTTRVLNNISCTVNAGDFVVMVGTNGAGKTTFFDVISGTIKPTHGTLSFDNQDLTSVNEQQRSLIISRVFQDPSLNCVPTMSVAENVALMVCKGEHASLKKAINEDVLITINNIAMQLNLDANTVYNKPMSALSGGQRQTISFLLATLIKPKILLLDEPTAALDPNAATQMLSFVIDYIKKHAITTLMITHDPYLALALGDKIWVLEKGCLIKQLDNKEKKGILPHELIGQIPYEQFHRR